MSRKIIQIAPMPATEIDDEHMLVLCNDGTVWLFTPRHGEWKELPAIPRSTGELLDECRQEYQEYEEQYESLSEVRSERQKKNA